MAKFKEKICAEPQCGKLFTPTNGKAKYCAKIHEKKCSNCDSSFTGKPEQNLCKGCSNALRLEKVKASNLEKYGVEWPLQNKEIREKTQESSLEKYGVKHPLQNEAILQKAKDTIEEKYGVRHGLNASEIFNKTRETLKQNHNVDHPGQSPEIREKIIATTQKNYGVNYPLQSEEIIARFSKTVLARYGYDYPMQISSVKEKAAKTRELNAKENYNKISKTNQQWKRDIEDRFSLSDLTFEKPLGPHNIDIHIPSANLYLDIHPTFSHNAEYSIQCFLSKCNLPCEKHRPKKIYYHYERALKAREENVTLLQIYDWDDKEKIIKLLAGKIAEASKHSARKLELKKIAQREANKFLAEYHIQGPAKKQSHCYGLYKESELLAVATFGPGRFKTKAEYEWIRYAVKQGHIIHGASSKLWRAFQTEVKPSTAISYIDFNHTTAPQTFLHTVGFEELKPTGPQLMWSKRFKKIYNNSLLAQGADRLLGTSYGRPEECGLNNRDIMLLEGWLPVYTAGNRVFWWTANEKIDTMNLEVKE